MYNEYKGKIPNCLYDCLQESLNLDLVIIQIIRFFILKMLLVCGEFLPENYTMGYYWENIRKINHT
jgi:hypothetical protein